MTYPQCTVARPKADFSIRVPGSKSKIKFKVGEECWVQSPAYQQTRDGAIMIGKKRQPMGQGYYFSFAQCEELFTFT